jgi:hypothetical protein
MEEIDITIKYTQRDLVFSKLCLGIVPTVQQYIRIFNRLFL